MTKTPCFSQDSLNFLLKAARQKKPEWLEKNRNDYEQLLLEPLKFLAAQLKVGLSELAPHYHFPQKGIGRLKRSVSSAKEHGGLYRNWMHYSAAKPRESRFENNPNLYFLLNPEDRDDPVLLAGGLFMPSSRQLRAIREAIATDASAFDELFRNREFSLKFKGGFSKERSSSRPPRGFDPAHPRMDWLKLQAYFVWKPYPLKQFTSPRLSERVIEDCRQIIRLNALLEDAVAGKIRRGGSEKVRNPRRRSNPAAKLSSVIESVEAIQRPMDF